MPRSPTRGSAACVTTSARRREGFGLAWAGDTTTDVQIDDWSLKLDGGEYAARIAARDFSLDLRFSRTEPVLLQGESRLLAQGRGSRAARAITTASLNSR